MNIKYPRLDPPYRVYWCWDITYECNYRCSYCIVDRWRETRYISINEWKIIWDEIFENYGSTHIRFSGGEPFVYPNFIELLKILGEKHTLNITTNLSFNAKELLKETASIIDKCSLSLSASYHPEYQKLNDFIKKVIYLKSNGIYVSVSIVAWPPILKNIPLIKRNMEENNIEFLIIPLQGRFFDKNYPEDYTEQELIFLKNMSVTTSNPASKDMINFKVNKEDNNIKKRLCRMGQNFGLIRPNGDVFRCCTFEKDAYLGNIIDRTFKLLDKPTWCEINPCTCYRAMLVGEEDKYPLKWDPIRHKEGLYYIPNNGN